VKEQYLLDTNVISESRKKRPNEGVLAFLSTAESSTLYLSVLVIGELRKGILFKKKSDPEAAKKIASWVDGLESNFADRILEIDIATAKLWGELSAPQSRPVVDTLLAATAIVHKLTLVTRNTSDVQGIHVQVLNPWK
jgi:toxin FitB